MFPDTPFNRVSRARLDPRMQQFWNRSKVFHGDTTFFEVMVLTNPKVA